MDCCALPSWECGCLSRPRVDGVGGRHSPAFFVVAGAARGTLLKSASAAALSFESAAEETGRRELWLARPISWTARALPADVAIACERDRENPRATAAGGPLQALRGCTAGARARRRRL